MKKAEQAIADKIIAHHIQLMRYTAGEKQKVFNILMQMQTELKAKLQNGLTSYEKARVAKVLNQCTVLIDRYYSGIQTQMNLTGLAKTEGEATKKAMASIGIEGSLPAPSVFKAMISDTLLTGAPLADWWEKLGQDVSFKVVSQIRQGIAQGETLQDIITRVVGNPKKGIPGVMEASRRNASTLVHDTVMQITNNAKMAVYKENSDVVKGVEQLSTLDSKTSDICIAYSGAKWDLDGEPIGGTTLPFDGGPPRHPNCLAGDTIISAAGISQHYKRWFDGEVVVLSITGIDDVTITPNHPVLTDHGWVAAGLLKQGDNLVFCEDIEATMIMLNPNNHHMETSIKDIGNSLLMSGGVITPVVPTSAEDFHGDGTINGEVDIILANSFLTDNGQIRCNEQIIKRPFTLRHFLGIVLNSFRTFTQFFKSGFTSPSGVLCGAGAGASCINAGAGRLNTVGLADSSDRQTESLESIKNDATVASNTASNITSGLSGKISGMKFDNFAIVKELLALYGQIKPCKSVSDSVSTEPDTFGNFSDRLARHIGFVKLQNVTVRKYASHVYNLQSELGWFIVNITQPQYKNKGIIVHNCRSVLVPVLIPWKELGVNVEPPKGTRASDLGPVPADMSFDAFLKRHDKEYQDELLGKGKADLWRSGKISLRDLISQDGRPMTLKDLRAGL